MRFKATTVPLALVTAFALPATAQTLLDIDSLRELDEAEILSVDGREIGEIEDVLIDQNGNPVAVAVELEDTLLGIGDDDVVFSFDQLTYQGGNYVTSLTDDEVGQLPRFDD